MKPAIDQYILDQLPIRRFEDARFKGSNTQNMIYFYWYFTMEDDTRECATVLKLSIYYNRKILN